MPKAVVTKRTNESLKRGESIFKEGDIGEEMYIIKSGSVEVVKKLQGEEVILAKLQAGSFFGEMALFGDKHRSATIRAIENTELVVIDKAILKMQLDMTPDWFVAIMRTLVERLKDTNKRLKSRYSIGIEYSILKSTLWIVKHTGKHESGGLVAELAPVIKDVSSILSISEEEILAKYRDFTFVHMINASTKDDTITIQDEDKLLDFILFLQAKNDKKTRMTSKFEELKENGEQLQYFERIYRLLSRKKGIKE